MRFCSFRARFASFRSALRRRFSSFSSARCASESFCFKLVWGLVGEAMASGFGSSDFGLVAVVAAAVTADEVVFLDGSKPLKKAG
jgi:hypothetical protein